MYKIENEYLLIEVNSKGAELTRIYDKITKKEMLWNGDEAYWKRHAPVLFPIVGSLKDGQYQYQGKQYAMSQHGFARDLEFTMVEQQESSIWFLLKDNEQTRAQYPFSFSLMIGYTLRNHGIEVSWKVRNLDCKQMYFSIGAHPAFYCPIKEGEKQTDYFIKFQDCTKIQYKKLTANGLCKPEVYIVPLEEGVLPITETMFDEDAWIIENSQTTQVSLLTPEKKPYVTVSFDAPLLGIWSPAGKQAPFVCIEPWYGRCDGEEFAGTLEQRTWGQMLNEQEMFQTSYQIEIPSNEQN